MFHHRLSIMRFPANLCLNLCIIDREVKVIKFRGDPSRMSGIVEVRGIVNKDGTISYGEFTQYDNEFGKLKICVHA